MEDVVTEKYHISRVIQDFVFSSWKKGCIESISWQVYNKTLYLPSYLVKTNPPPFSLMRIAPILDIF